MFQKAGGLELEVKLVVFVPAVKLAPHPPAVTGAVRLTCCMRVIAASLHWPWMEYTLLSAGVLDAMASIIKKLVM